MIWVVLPKDADASTTRRPRFHRSRRLATGLVHKEMHRAGCAFVRLSD